MAWQPVPSQLAQLAQLLRDSLSGHDTAALKNAEQVGSEELLITLLFGEHMR